MNRVILQQHIAWKGAQSDRHARSKSAALDDTAGGRFSKTLNDLSEGLAGLALLFGSAW
jgi:hypothetical protein